MNTRKILYKQFLTDKKSYNLNVSYWRVKLQKALDEKFSRDVNYIEDKDFSGKKFYDGNPIYSYYNLSKRKGLRIVQENPEELENYDNIKLLEAWISSTTVRIEEQSHSKIEIKELVISLYLTHETVNQCLNLTKQWFFGDLTPDQLKNY